MDTADGGRVQGLVPSAGAFRGGFETALAHRGLGAGGLRFHLLCDGTLCRVVKEAVPALQQLVTRWPLEGVTGEAAHHGAAQHAQLRNVPPLEFRGLPGQRRAAGDLVADLLRREGAREDAARREQLVRDHPERPHVRRRVGHRRLLAILDGKDGLGRGVQQAER